MSTDISQGIICGQKVSPGTLRAMAANRRKDAEMWEERAAADRHIADVYEHVAAARERGEM